VTSRPDASLAARLAGLALAAALAAPAGCCAYSAPAYHGPTSDHFDGERFHNMGGAAIDAAAVARWMVTRQPGAWPDYVDDPAGAPPPRRVGDGAIRVTFVNHATVLVQMDGVNVLTDPVWSDRVGPEAWAGPRRRRPPGIHFADLPPIDAVLVSHDHYDHMDLPTLASLAAAHHPTIVAGLGNRALLDGEGIGGGVDLDWWQSIAIGHDVRIVSVPAQHTSMRGLCDRDRTLWAGYVIAGPSGKVYFAGDTGYGPHFAAIRERIGPVRVALLPIGAFKPRWVMAPVHMAPADAVRAARDLGATTSLAIHFGTFAQADDGDGEPVAELERALGAAPSPPRFWVLRQGEGRLVP
jgi:L-ascorbate metabolism protein UlaG (beta-lactamase superfamily)